MSTPCGIKSDGAQNAHVCGQFLHVAVTRVWLLCCQGYLLSWDVFWDLTSNLIISGCDSTLTVLGMSAVISSVAHYLGLSILAFIGTCVCVCVVQTFFWICSAFVVC